MGEDLLYCYNKGCGLKFNPKENGPEACICHPGAPYFHDAYKIWSCCNKKSTDFGTWLGLKGCTKSYHNGVKPAEEALKVPSVETVKKNLQQEETIVVWNGLNKPANRDGLSRKMQKLSLQPSEGLLNALMKQKNLESGESDIHVGVACHNSSCNEIYKGDENKESKCVYHPGVAVFHEGMKYWSCCNKKTSDFSAFLEQTGCTDGQHNWSKNEKVALLREDWFSRSGYIHLNIYCKAAVPDDCCLESDGLVLRAKIVHGYGTKETELNYELFGEIDPANSKVIISERKLEIVLKQKGVGGWPRLTYQPPIDASLGEAAS